MRTYAALLLVILVTTACRSSVLVSGPAFDPDAAFASLPSPGALAVAATSRTTASLKGASSVSGIPGGIYVDDPPGRHVIRNTEQNTCTLEGHPGEFAYCFFQSNLGMFASVSQFTRFLADAEWPTGAPASPEGLWIGVPDYANNRWHWLGPAPEQPTWLSSDPPELFGLAETEHFVVVNYSLKQLELSCLYIESITQGDLTEDGWIYYAHYDPDHPENLTSISRIQPLGDATPELIRQGTTTEAYSDPRIAYVDEDEYVAYTYTAGGYGEVHRAELDGADPIVIRSSTERGFLPGAWNPDGSTMMWLREHDDGRFNLYGKPVGEPGGGLVSREVDDIRYVNWDATNRSIDYSALFSLAVATPHPRMVIAGIWEDGELPFDAEPQVVVDNGTETAVHPYTYAMHNAGEGYWIMGFVFASRERDDDTYNIYWYQGIAGEDGEISTRLLDPALDLVSPAVSPRRALLAYIAMQPGEDRGRLYVTDFLTGYQEEALLLAENVIAPVVWYRP